MSADSIPIPTTDPGVPAPHSTSSFWHQPPDAFLHAHRTTSTLPSRCKTLIIGSGIAGTMTFHRLHELGLATATVMLEARNSTFGATGRNGGHCKPMLYHYSSFSAHAAEFGVHETLQHVRFERLNLALVREYVRGESVACDFTELPSADVYYTRDEFELARANIEALRQAAPELGALIRLVDGDTDVGRAELKTVVRTPTAVGAAVSSAAKLWPYKLVSHILTKGVKEQGLNLQTRTPATALRRAADGAGWTVVTPRGEITAERVVFATNAHTAHLLPVFSGWIYPVRAQVAALVPPRSLLERPLTHSYGLVRHERKMAEYLIQRPVGADGSGGEIILGGARELAENMGVGKMDDAIDQPVAEFLRTAISRFFADETGYPGEKERGREEDNGLRQSFIEKFERLRMGGHDVWDAAEGMGMGVEEIEKEEKLRNVVLKSCTARAEWSGTMGFSRDERPFVGRVPAVSKKDAEARGVAAMEYTNGLWMLAGFEGHGMAYTTGSAKALAMMIKADEDGCSFESDKCGVYEWFPRSFEVTPERLGLLGDEWVVVDDDTTANK